MMRWTGLHFGHPVDTDETRQTRRVTFFYQVFKRVQSLFSGELALREQMKNSRKFNSVVLPFRNLLKTPPKYYRCTSIYMYICIPCTSPFAVYIRVYVCIRGGMNFAINYCKMRVDPPGSWITCQKIALVRLRANLSSGFATVAGKRETHTELATGCSAVA